MMAFPRTISTREHNAVADVGRTVMAHMLGRMAVTSEDLGREEALPAVCPEGHL